MAVLDKIIGSKSKFGVTGVGLNSLGSSGGFCLPAEGFELAAEFFGEVINSVEVALHSGQFSECFFFASAVFENTCSFFDESAAFFGTGLEDFSKFSLPDDDMHFAADAGVGE